MELAEDIPAQFQAAAGAALDWINTQQARNYKLTGLVDYESALAAAEGEPYDIGLVLCYGELCARELVRVTPDRAQFAFSFVDAPLREVPPLLDPPEGVRSTWLDAVLARHEFVLLLFYRGLW
ncbi:MAG: hypothetical protein AAF993_17580 [Pseudomonadota bacterium]